MADSDYKTVYQGLLAKLDGLTAESQRRFPNQLQCRKGCGMCCHGLFDIGVLDALLLHQAWLDCEATMKVEIETAAELLLAKVQNIAPAWQYPYDLKDVDEDEVDRVLEKIGMVACPVLDTQSGCRLYDSRPFYCRVHGLKIQDTQGPADIETSCELNFQAGDPPREAWPSADFTGQFSQESQLISEHRLNPESRFIIPAVTTRRFSAYSVAAARFGKR